MNPQSLRIHFLGTGTSSGVPMIGCDCAVCTSVDTADKRLRTSILVQSATTTLVVDTTPDFRYQMLRAKVKNLDAVVFTHAHKDHIAGLDDIRAYNFFSKTPMPVYVDAIAEEGLRREYAYAFSTDKYPGVPQMNIHSINAQDLFTIGDIIIQPIQVMHSKLPVLGFRFGDFTYITDANYISEQEKEKIKGSAVLVLNALRKEKHASHFTLDEAIALAEELEVPNVYFTHISHQLGLHAAVSTVLPSHIQLAKDGLEICL